MQRITIRYFPQPDAPAITHTVTARERKAMPATQRNAVNALIRRLCANYDRAGGGDCLLLDMPCPQLPVFPGRGTARRQAPTRADYGAGRRQDLRILRQALPSHCQPGEILRRMQAEGTPEAESRKRAEKIP